MTSLTAPKDQITAVIDAHPGLASSTKGKYRKAILNAVQVGIDLTVAA